MHTASVPDMMVMTALVKTMRVWIIFESADSSLRRRCSSYTRMYWLRLFAGCLFKLKSKLPACVMCLLVARFWCHRKCEIDNARRVVAVVRQTVAGEKPLSLNYRRVWMQMRVRSVPEISNSTYHHKNCKCKL